jgi:hypothetical protein
MLDIPFFVPLPMLPFALAYAWHEVIQALFILQNWQDKSAQRLDAKQCEALERASQ